MSDKSKELDDFISDYEKENGAFTPEELENAQKKLLNTPEVTRSTSKNLE